MRRGSQLLVLAGSVFLAAVLVSRCSNPAPPSAPPPAQSTPQPAAQSSAPQMSPSPLFGEMKPVVSVKELMEDMIDPIADNIFDAVWWDATPKGVVAHKPQTDEDWEKIKVGAVTIAEGIYLLKVPRPFTPPGDVNNSLGPNPPELSPEQIKAKIDKDPVLWIAKIEALRNVALAALDAVKRKDVDALFEASGNLDVACEECHLEYWYPGDKATVLRERQVRAQYERPGSAASANPAKK